MPTTSPKKYRNETPEEIMQRLDPDRNMPAELYQMQLRLLAVVGEINESCRKRWYRVDTDLKKNINATSYYWRNTRMTKPPNDETLRRLSQLHGGKSMVQLESRIRGIPQKDIVRERFQELLGRHRGKIAFASLYRRP